MDYECPVLNFPEATEVPSGLDGHSDEKPTDHPPWEGTVASRIRSLNDLNKPATRSGPLPSRSVPRLFDWPTTPDSEQTNYRPVYESLDKVTSDHIGRRTNPFVRRGSEASSDNNGVSSSSDRPRFADTVIHSPTPRWLATHPTFYRDRSPSPNPQVDQVLDDRGGFGRKDAGNYFAGANIPTSSRSGYQQMPNAAHVPVKYPALRHVEPLSTIKPPQPEVSKPPWGAEGLKHLSNDQKEVNPLSATNPRGMRVQKRLEPDAISRSMPSLREPVREPVVTLTPDVEQLRSSVATNPPRFAHRGSRFEDSGYKNDSKVERIISTERPYQPTKTRPSVLYSGLSPFQHGNPKKDGHVEHMTANPRGTQSSKSGLRIDEGLADETQTQGKPTSEIPGSMLRERASSPSIGLGPRTMTFGRSPPIQEMPLRSLDHRESFPARPERAIRPAKEGFGVEQPAPRASKERPNARQTALTPTARLLTPELGLRSRAMSLEGLRKAMPLADPHPFSPRPNWAEKPSLRFAPTVELGARAGLPWGNPPTSPATCVLPNSPDIGSSGRITSLERTWKAEHTEGDGYTLRETFMSGQPQSKSMSSLRQNEYVPSGSIVLDYTFDKKPADSAAQSSSLGASRNLSPASKQQFRDGPARPDKEIQHGAHSISSHGTPDTDRLDFGPGQTRMPASERQHHHHHSTADQAMRHRSSRLWSPVPKHGLPGIIDISGEPHLRSPESSSVDDYFHHETPMPALGREESLTPRAWRAQDSPATSSASATTPSDGDGRSEGIHSEGSSSSAGYLKTTPDHSGNPEMPPPSPLTFGSGTDGARRLFGWTSATPLDLPSPSRTSPSNKKEYSGTASLSVVGVRSIEVHVQTSDQSKKERLGSTATVEGPGYSKLLSLRPLSPSHYTNFIGPKEELPRLQDGQSPLPVTPKEVVIDLGGVAVAVKADKEVLEEYRPLMPPSQSDHSRHRLGLIRESSDSRTSGQDARPESHRTVISFADRPDLQRNPNKFSDDVASIDAILADHRRVLDEVIVKLQSSGPRLERVRSLSHEHLQAASHEEIVAENPEAHQPVPSSPLPSTFTSVTEPEHALREVGAQIPPEDSPTRMRERSDVAEESGLQVESHEREVLQPRSLPEMFDELQAIQAASDEILSSRDELRRVLSEAVMAASPTGITASPHSDRRSSSGSRGSMYIADEDLPAMPSVPRVMDRAVQTSTPSPLDENLGDEDAHSTLEDSEDQYARLLESPIDEEHPDPEDRILGSRIWMDKTPSTIRDAAESPGVTAEPVDRMHTLWAPTDEKRNHSVSPMISWTPPTPGFTQPGSPADSLEHPSLPASTARSLETVKVDTSPVVSVSNSKPPSPQQASLSPPIIIHAATFDHSAFEPNTLPPQLAFQVPHDPRPVSPSSEDDDFYRLDRDPPMTPPPQETTRRQSVRQRILSLEEDSEGWAGGGGANEQINRLKSPFW